MGITKTMQLSEAHAEYLKADPDGWCNRDNEKEFDPDFDEEDPGDAWDAAEEEREIARQGG